MPRVSLEPVTIASGQTTSNQVELNGRTVVGVYMPAAFTGSALTFLVEDADGNDKTMADGAGADVSKTVAADKMVLLNPADFAAVNKVKLVSGSSEAADRHFYLAVREVE